MSRYTDLATQALKQYDSKVFPTRFAWLLMLYESSKGPVEFRGMTSFELEAYAHQHIGITRAAITSNLRRAYNIGLVSIEYVSEKGSKGACAHYELTTLGIEFVESLLGKTK